MKTLLTTAAIFEGATAVAMLAAPSTPASLLLGAPLDTPAALAVARIAGAALLALAVACWHARAPAACREARGIIAAMLLYNTAAVAVLVHARLGLGLTGVGLWPAAILHTALAAWCATALVNVLRSVSPSVRESP